MKKSLPKAGKIPDQHEVNCLAAFIETAEELEREPFYRPDKSDLSRQGQAAGAQFGDRFHFRSALATFRRLWPRHDGGGFNSICELLKRIEGPNAELELIRTQQQESVERQWTNLPLNSGEVVELWLNAVFSRPTPKGSQRSPMQDRINFHQFAKAHGQAFLEFVCRATLASVGTCYFNLLKIARPALARWEKEHGLRPEFEMGFPFGPTSSPSPAGGYTPAGQGSMTLSEGETREQKFERILGQASFKGLKAILDGLRRERAKVIEEVARAGSYQELLGKLGYRIVLAPQIHVQDCYSRLGPEGGIRAVLPYHDIAAYSTLVTLVNFDSTVTTTAQTVGFFEKNLREFKAKLSS